MSKVPWPTTAGWLAVAAIGSAALAVLAGRHYLQAREIELRAEARVGLEGRPVVVASHALAAGAMIAAADLASRQMPERFADSESLGPESAGQLLGRRVIRARRAGDPILARDLESQDAMALSSRVDAGMRAVTLPVDELGSLSGLLRPGDRVDLYFLPPAGGKDPRIGLLLPSVLILATGAQTRMQPLATTWQPQGTGFASITVQLSPEDAERLSLAQRVGQVIPVLRRVDDPSPTADHIQSAQALLSGPVSRHVATARPAERPAMEIIIGGRGEGVATTDAVSLPHGSPSLEGANP